MTTPTKFKAGQTYTCRSLCDHECIFSYKVLKRTAKTITIKTHTGVMRRGVSLDNGDSGETCYPEGRYSMCPIIRA